MTDLLENETGTAPPQLTLAHVAEFLKENLRISLDVTPSYQGGSCIWAMKSFVTVVHM